MNTTFSTPFCPFEKLHKILLLVLSYTRINAFSFGTFALDTSVDVVLAFNVLDIKSRITPFEAGAYIDVPELLRRFSNFPPG